MQNMKRILFVIALVLAFFQSNAQIAVPVDTTAMYRVSHGPAPLPEIAARKSQTPEYQIATGRNLLISAGALTAAGAALFPVSYTLIDVNSDFVRWAVPIGSVAMMGASVPCYIAGAVLYCKGKKTKRLEPTPTGIAVKF